MRPEFAQSGTESDFRMSGKCRDLHPEEICLRRGKPVWTLTTTRVKKKCKLPAVRSKNRLRWTDRKRSIRIMNRLSLDDVIDRNPAEDLTISDFENIEIE